MSSESADITEDCLLTIFRYCNAFSQTSFPDISVCLIVQSLQETVQANLHNQPKVVLEWLSGLRCNLLSTKCLTCLLTCMNSSPCALWLWISSICWGCILTLYFKKYNVLRSSNNHSHVENQISLAEQWS